MFVVKTFGVAYYDIGIVNAKENDTFSSRRMEVVIFSLFETFPEAMALGEGLVKCGSFIGIKVSGFGGIEELPN